MRALSLWQPWASAMRDGFKKIETRSWATSYTGDLVICSAKRKPTMDECGDEDIFRMAMGQPYGFALCVVELQLCLSTNLIVRSDVTQRPPCIGITQQEWELGDYSHGRYGWMTTNLRKLKNPVPIVGRQGLWIVSAADEQKIKEQL